MCVCVRVCVSVEVDESLCVFLGCLSVFHVATTARMCVSVVCVCVKTHAQQCVCLGVDVKTTVEAVFISVSWVSLSLSFSPAHTLKDTHL